MPVLHCFDRYLPLTENWIFRQLRSLSDTRVVTAARSYLPGSPWDPRFRRIRYPVPWYDPRFRTHWLDALHCKTLRVLWRGYEDYVVRRARGHGVGIVHSHFAPTAWLHRRVAERLARPHVISFYGFDYLMLPRSEPAWRERYSHLFASAGAILAEGPHAASLLREAGCPASRIRVVPIGVNVEEIPVARRAKRAGQLRLVQVASFREKKGHVYTVRAFLRAAAACPDLTLTLIGRGSGEIEGELARLVGEAGMERRVRFLPEVEPARLHSSLAAYDVFIHPSVHASDADCEGGAPVVLLDAQATGMPVIATYHCDIPESVRDGETGRLVPEKDVDALAAAIESFYRMDGAEFERISRAARAYVESRFDVRRSAASLEAIYREVARPSPGAC